MVSVRALQGGADYYVTKDWFLNLDVKKIWMSTDVYATNLGNANLGKLHLDPLDHGVGFGTHF
ncbi:MAG: OmpW family outer membrane protein [Burkholderiaceae bacterium]